MKAKPVDGGRYQRAVKPLKKASKKICRDLERQFGLPRGCLRMNLTGLSDNARAEIMRAGKPRS